MNGPEETYRIGQGSDLHRLVEGRPLVLGGVSVPFEKGLLGHSDADVLTHAVTNAVLGALGLGDIGRHFPDDDPAYEGADSLELLRVAAELMERAGYEAANVDATIVAPRPKLTPFVDRMAENLAKVLGVERGRVNVKATTNEGLGPEGRGEAMSAQAAVLLRRRGR